MPSVAMATSSAAAATAACTSATASTTTVPSPSPSHDSLRLEALVSDPFLAADAERVAELLFLKGALVYRGELNREHRGAAEVAHLFGPRYLFERLGE